MAVLTPAQIAGHAKAAGFTGESLVIMTAIALGESGGDTQAHNTKGLDNSYGLWQVNMLGALGPSRRKKYGLKSNEELFNPATNARVAYGISGGGKNFTPWSVYTLGLYRKHMSAARTAAKNADTSGSSTDAQQIWNPIDGIADITKFFVVLTKPSTWMAIGMTVGGALLLIVAVFMISGQGAKLKGAAGAVTNMIPHGRGIKAIAKGK